MLTVHDADALSDALSDAQRPVGFVPTLGGIHAGHLALVERARRDCPTVVASVFLNPLQFDRPEDLERYPRTPEKDLAALAAAGVDVVFMPSPDFAPAEPTVQVAELTSRFEGEGRPGHFDGVTTIVHKLFTTVGPDRAYFGEKDYQQLLVVRRMVAEQGLDVEVVACPTVRADDGVALSSRNALLTGAQRAKAATIATALGAVAGGWDGDADTARVRLRRRLEDTDGLDCEYADIVDAATLEPVEGETDAPARAIVAARIGGVRLIDNMALKAVGRRGRAGRPT